MLREESKITSTSWSSHNNSSVAENKNDESIKRSFPTDPFTTLTLQDQEIGEVYVVQERRTTDFEAPKLWKGHSGYQDQ